MSYTYDEMIALARQAKSMKKKLKALDEECTERGIGLARMKSLIEGAPMPDETRELLREAVQPFIDRCTKGGKKRNES